MAEMLLINPAKRGHKRARRNPATRRTSVRRNPIAKMHTARRRRNPMHALHRRVMHRRRRNPIRMPAIGGYMRDIREALMGGAGAVVFDVVHAQIAKFLPATLKVTPGQIGIGDAVRAIITVFVGGALNGVTRGFSKKAAMASLTVDAHKLLSGFVPANLKGIGYFSPAMVAQGTNRVGPIRQGMNAYLPAGQTPLLNAYLPPGQSPLLSGAAQRREGVSTYY